MARFRLYLEVDHPQELSRPRWTVNGERRELHVGMGDAHLLLSEEVAVCLAAELTAMTADVEHSNASHSNR
jgi:hypothetical protein